MQPELTREYARSLDGDDPLRRYRERFYLPNESIYLTGNSLGLQSQDARESTERVMNEWRDLGVRGWLDAESPWFHYAERLGRIGAELVGARADEVVATGTTTVNIHALVSAFYSRALLRQSDPSGATRPGGAKILADELNFPTDLYALNGQVRLRGGDPSTELVLVPSEDGRTLDERRIIDLMTDDVVLVFLPTVLYGSGQLLDVEAQDRIGQQPDAGGGVPDQLLRYAMESGQEGFWSWNRTQQSLYMSPRCRELTGVMAVESAATLQRLTELMHDDDRPRVLAELSTGFNSGLKFEVECRLWRAPTTEWQVIRCAGQSSSKNEDADHWVLGSIVDVTE